MLQRTKYSRLRSDSLSSLEDRTQDTRPAKGALASNPPWAPLHVQGTHPAHGESTLRGFIPRMASISLLGLGGLTHKTGHRNKGRLADEQSLPCSVWTSGQTSPSVPHTVCHSRGHSALRCTKRPIALQRAASIPLTPGCPFHPRHDALSRWKIPPVAEEGSRTCLENMVVNHHLKYMGSLEVIQSMRTLDFETRMQVTREAISRLCEVSTGVKSAISSKRPLQKAVSVVLGQSNLQFSGRSVILTVSADSVTLTTACPLQTIAHHSMQSISFASGGDSDMADFIAYVAKDPADRRSCYIMKCPVGGACEVISSIGQAFQTRFRQLLSQTSFIPPTTPRSVVGSSDRVPEWTVEDHSERKEDSNYYNQIHGKLSPAGGMQDMRESRQTRQQDGSIRGVQVCRSSKLASLYENCSITHGTLAPPTETGVPEISMERTEDADYGCQSVRISQELIEEEWFHGRLGREKAESLLSSSGDFLVRESCSALGQYVLSGMEGATVKHLLLVDPNGQVRTCDQLFQSVSHLVRFHMESRMPIASGSSELCLTLRQPILHKH